jgi:hypothetical protein
MVAGYQRAISSHESPVIIDNASQSHARERSTERERKRRRQKLKRRRKRRERCCIGLRDPISWTVFGAAIALYLLNLMISFLILLDYIGKVINLGNKQFDSFRIVYRSGIFPDYSPRLNMLDPPDVDLWWDFALADLRIDPFHVFHWLVVELVIAIVLGLVFYYETHEFMYGRRKFWLERLAVQIIRIVCCAVFGLVSFGPISYCANVPGRDVTAEGDPAVEAFNMCDFVDSRGEAQRRYDYRQNVNDARKARQEYFDGQKVQDYFWWESINVAAIGVLGIVMMIVHAGLAIYWKNQTPEDSKRSSWYGFWYGDNFGNVFWGRRDSDSDSSDESRSKNEIVWWNPGTWFGGGNANDNTSNSEDNNRRSRWGRNIEPRVDHSSGSTRSSNDDVRFAPPIDHSTSVFGNVGHRIANLFVGDDEEEDHIIHSSDQELLMDSDSSGGYHQDSSTYHHQDSSRYHREATCETAIFDEDALGSSRFVVEKTPSMESW